MGAHMENRNVNINVNINTNKNGIEMELKLKMKMKKTQLCCNRLARVEINAVQKLRSGYCFNPKGVV